MDTPDNPGIKPPNPNDAKKAKGSFAKRNTWLIVVLAVVLLISGGSWYIYTKVRRLTQYHHQNITIKQPDSVDTSLPYETDELFTTPNDPYASIVRVNIEAGAINYKLKDTTGDLFSVNTITSGHRYRLDVDREGTVPVLNFKLYGNKSRTSYNKTPDSANIRLNVKPQWELNVKTGGSNFEADLSKFKIRSLKFEGGAAVCKVRLGNYLSTTKISFSTGASDITIEIPKDAACHIHLTSSLSSNTFDGFIKKGETEYETHGFDSSKNKILIEFTGAISDYKVNRY